MILPVGTWGANEIQYIKYTSEYIPKLQIHQHEGDLVLLWDQASEQLGARKFKPMWRGTYVVKWVLEKGAYELVDYEEKTLVEPRNGLYLKKYYA